MAEKYGLISIESLRPKAKELADTTAEFLHRTALPFIALDEHKARDAIKRAKELIKGMGF